MSIYRRKQECIITAGEDNTPPPLFEVVGKLIGEAESYSEHTCCIGHLNDTISVNIAKTAC